MPLAALLRDLTRLITIRRHQDPPAPRGTTHILLHLPYWLLARDTTAGQGFWEIQTLANHLAGTPADSPPGFDGPSDVCEPDLRAFAQEALARPVSLTRFDVEIGDGDGGTATTWHAEPAFYITPR